MEIKLLFTVGIISLFSCGVTQEPSKVKHNGISFVAPVNEIDDIPFKNVKQETKCNALAIIPFAFTYGDDNPKVIFNHKKQWWGEQIEGVAACIKLAKKENLNLLLKPQLWLMDGEYTGNFYLGSHENWQVFENSYRDYILSFALIAESEEVETFCIGTELGRFIENRPQYWSELIDTIRTVYHGKLTYAANWDDYEKVPFWNKLDYIGIDAYFPLADDKLPNKMKIQKSWKPIKNSLQNFSEEYGKSILFTEFGYRSMDYSLAKPWESASQYEVNMINQQVGLDAFFDTFWNEDFIEGGYLWKWFHESEKAGGIKDIGYTPQNKPALKIIQKHYTTSGIN